MVREMHFTLEQALWELPMAQGFALQAWSTEANPWVSMERTGLGYIGQEIVQKSGNGK